MKIFLKNQKIEYTAKYEYEISLKISYDSKVSNA